MTISLLTESHESQSTGLERYKMIRELGHRPGRQTLLALDTRTQQQVVLKQLTFGDELSWDEVKYFKREAETLRSLNHPAVPRYLDFFEFEQEHCSGFALVQTYIDAPSLETYVAHQCLNEKELRHMAHRLLKDLRELHQCQPALIHRDLKPSNILYDGTRAYIVDFGTVQTLLAQPGATISVVGTYGYMAPEQFGGQALPASDLYSLGATLIYAATGKHPAELPQQELRIQFEAPQLSPGFCSWLRQLTAPSLGARFSSAEEALLALHSIPQTACTFYRMLERRSLPPLPPEGRLMARWGEDYLEIEIYGARFWLVHERAKVKVPLSQCLQDRTPRSDILVGVVWCALALYAGSAIFLPIILLQQGVLQLSSLWGKVLLAVIYGPFALLLASMRPERSIGPTALGKGKPQADGAIAFNPHRPFNARLIIDAHQITVFQFQRLPEGRPEQLMYRLQRSQIWQLSLKSGKSSCIQLHVGNQVLKLLGHYKGSQWLSQLLSRVLELPLEQ